jgi:hypothetical protein
MKTLRIYFLFMLLTLSGVCIWAADVVVLDKSAQPAATHQKTKHYLIKKDCDLAVDLLGQCIGNDLPCDQDQLIGLMPSAPRSTYVYLSRKKGFSEKNFTQLCKQLCKTSSLELEDDVLKMKICRN